MQYRISSQNTWYAKISRNLVRPQHPYQLFKFFAILHRTQHFKTIEYMRHKLCTKEISLDLGITCISDEYPILLRVPGHTRNITASALLQWYSSVTCMWLVQDRFSVWNSHQTQISRNLSCPYIVAHFDKHFFAFSTEHHNIIPVLLVHFQRDLATVMDDIGKRILARLSLWRLSYIATFPHSQLLNQYPLICLGVVSYP